MKKLKFDDHVKLHKISRDADEILTELYLADLLNNKKTLEEKEEVADKLRFVKKTMTSIEDSNARNYYREGKANGILDGILIGEFLMLGSFGLGRLIRYYLDKRA